MTVKWFPSAAVFLLLLLAIYGMIGAIFNYRHLGQLTSTVHNNEKWPFDQKPIYKVFICIQLCYLIAAILGITAAIRDSTLYFFWSFFFLFGIFSALFTFGIICIRVSSMDLRSALGNVTYEEDDVVQWAFDTQNKSQFCVIHSYVHWEAYLQELPNGNTSVPDCYCKRRIYYDEGTNSSVGLIVPNNTVADNGKFIYTKGCGPVISQMMISTKWIGSEMVIAGIFTFAVAIFIYSGLMKIYRARNDVNTTTNVSSEKLWQ